MCTLFYAVIMSIIPSFQSIHPSSFWNIIPFQLHDLCNPLSLLSSTTVYIGIFRDVIYKETCFSSKHSLLDNSSLLSCAPLWPFPYSIVGIFTQASPCIVFMDEDRTTVSSYVHPPLCIWETPLSGSHPVPLAFAGPLIFNYLRVYGGDG